MTAGPPTDSVARSAVEVVLDALLMVEYQDQVNAAPARSGAGYPAGACHRLTRLRPSSFALYSALSA